jgi:hypothetical protein
MVVFAPVWHKDPEMAVPQTIPVRTAKTEVINAVKIPIFLSPMNLGKNVQCMTKILTAYLKNSTHCSLSGTWLLLLRKPAVHHSEKS